MIFLQGRLHIRMTRAAGLVTGAVSGVLGGLFCMAGVPMSLYLLSMEEKEDYLATIQTFFAMVAVYSTALHGFSGFLTGTVLRAFLYSILAVALGAVAGQARVQPHEPRRAQEGGLWVHARERRAFDRTVTGLP